MKVTQADIDGLVRYLQSKAMPHYANIVERLSGDNKKLHRKLEVQRELHAQVFNKGKLPHPLPALYMDAAAPDKKKLRKALAPITKEKL